MVSYHVLFWQYSKFFLVRHLQEETWNNSQVPIIKNQKSKKEIPKNQSESLNSSSTASATASSTEKSKTKKRTGACVQADGLSKKVTKKAIVHDIFKGYKITNYGLYMETENGICTGKEGHHIIFSHNFVKGDALLKALKIFRDNVEIPMVIFGLFISFKSAYIFCVFSV